ncbi:conserved hypothetical protein [Microsporum canis CBS 113480]|uniref:Aminoglycoside phosphotransferase domain-containing protein n=1 Tax=Arthroderma otae (strain ATCC MYA-4605 / CBS 113480) TaxID=554155 RepID=C5FTE1_ARTOC|nr:conserved hypothetical protein [Microsporum canis CBS 113480]EEQ33144.1 conserved hypothetical protein [Microsporum canis CBS 113480]
MKTFPKSSFFEEKRAPTLPTPADIRLINESGNILDPVMRTTKDGDQRSIYIFLIEGETLQTRWEECYTHSDLVAPNIIPSRGPNPKVAAIIDWGQAGWHPAYWEYCKARRVRLEPELSDALQEERTITYLPLIMDPPLTMRHTIIPSFILFYLRCYSSAAIEHKHGPGDFKIVVMPLRQLFLSLTATDLAPGRWPR